MAQGRATVQVDDPGAVAVSKGRMDRVRMQRHQRLRAERASTTARRGESAELIDRWQGECNS